MIDRKYGDHTSYFGNITIIPIGSMYAIYMVTFTINIPQMLAYIPYMDPMGYNLKMIDEYKFAGFYGKGSHHSMSYNAMGYHGISFETIIESNRLRLCDEYSRYDKQTQQTFRNTDKIWHGAEMPI
jgi:hypothetical protein